ncbi:MAG: GIY-YIG nuclease family protein [Chitinophagaceae bacterium]|nr:GIY-YIG nuclease family protein [Chitinophagaceae bacterium]
MNTCLPAGREHLKMMVIVYVIRSYKDGRFYVGMTKDLGRRIQEHESGKTKSTKGFRPWKLIFTENFPSFSEARKREKYLKSGSGKEYIKTMAP